MKCRTSFIFCAKVNTFDDKITGTKALNEVYFASTVFDGELASPVVQSIKLYQFKIES